MCQKNDIPLNPNASLAVRMFDTRKIESKMHNAIRSWLNALLNFGLQRIIVAMTLPIHPTAMMMDETIPCNSHFQSNRI